MIYLDTSVAIPMFVPEPASDAIDAWFERCCAQKPEARFANVREASVAFVEAATGVAPADQPTESVFFPPVVPRISKPPHTANGATG